jgi:hypothetical protein
MLQIVASHFCYARVVSYNPSQCNLQFYSIATVIMIINYNHTVIMIVNYDPKTFIVQATGWTTQSMEDPGLGAWLSKKTLQGQTL